MDRLHTMRVFVRVVEAGSFAAAADALDLSPAAVTRNLADLEGHLGTRLLHRNTRHLALTDAGAEYYERCQRLLDGIEQAELAASRLVRDPIGKLRIGAPVAFFLHYLVPWLHEYGQRFPRVKMDVSLSDRAVDLVGEGFDVCLRIARRLDDGLVARRLGVTRMAVCASPAYLVRHGMPRTPEDLAHHICLHEAHQRDRDLWVFREGDRERGVRVRGNLAIDNGYALRAAAVAGMGVVLQPQFLLAEDLATGKLTEILRDYRAPDLGIYAVYPSQRHLSAKVRSFVDFVAEKLAPSAKESVA
jgi:DNA-binding transcriptional LysR family regulator